jgi:hypothetical protein
MSWRGEVSTGATAVLKNPWTMRDLEEAVKFLEDQGALPSHPVNAIVNAGNLTLIWRVTEPA